MNAALCFIISLLVVASAVGQENLSEANLKIRGIGSGSSYRSVIARFGQPASRKVESFQADKFSCIPVAHTLVKLGYPGLNFELLGDGRSRNLKVVELDVSSDRWSASGIKIGARPDHVVRRFGRPVSQEQKGTWMGYYYVTPGNSGTVRFEFRRARLFRIAMSETLC